MFYILINLLVGWILSLFGFNDLVINGMDEVFGVSMAQSGYYFLFALMGMVRYTLGNTFSVDIKELVNNHKKKKKVV